MASITPSEVTGFLEKMKSGKKLFITGEYDPDPYGGGTHWDYEMTYNVETLTNKFLCFSIQHNTRNFLSVFR